MTAVPTNETTPVWAQTRPVAPAEDTVDSEADDATDETDETDLALPPPVSPSGSAPRIASRAGIIVIAMLPPMIARATATRP